MASENQPEESAPQAAALIAPRQEEVVDGTSVTFEWERAEDVSEYKLEVSPSTQFEELLVDKSTTDSKVEVEKLPTDGQTYYWRVLARADDKWRGQERIESFISTTPDEAAAIREDEARHPQEEGELGPPGELVGTAAEEVKAEVSGDDAERRRLAQEQEMGVAEEGVETGQIFAIVAAISAAVLIIAFLLFFWVDIVTREARDAVVGLAGYPELQALELEAERRLTEYEAIDPEAGVYRIPIDRAMEMVLRERGVAPREMVPTRAGDEATAQQADAPAEME